MYSDSYAAMAIHVGCGSWTDKDYVGVLFAKGLPSSERLASYAAWFDRIELNSFYHAFPKREYVERWIAQVPAAFRFDVKLSGDFSEDPSGAAKGAVMERFLRAVEPFVTSKRLGVFLMTVPPSFTPEKHRLEELDGLVKNLAPHTLAVELRHRGWVEGEQRRATLDFFRARKLVLVSVDLAQVKADRVLPWIEETTHPHTAYVRLHGRNPNYAKAGSTTEGHHHDYTQKELEEIVPRLRALEKSVKEVHVTLNNHAEDFAPKAAIALKRLLGQPTLLAPPPRPGHQEELFG